MTDTEKKEESLNIANTIHGQISTSVKWDVGYNKPVAIENGLRFKVGGKRQTWIEVILDIASDTYIVRQVKITRKDGRTIPVVHTDIYCDALDHTITDIYYNH